MTGGNIVGVVPVDHTSSPSNGTLRASVDTSGPHTSVRVRCQFVPERGEEKKIPPDLNTSGSGWVKSHAIRVDSIGPLQGADRVSVNQPCQSFRLPVNLNDK